MILLTSLPVELISKKRNKGQCVKLYNPKPYRKGSSFSHLDTETYPRNLLNNVGGVKNYKVYNIWNKYEIGIMEDLGYKIDWENYCKMVENELPKAYYTLIVNMNDVKGSACYFKLKRSIDDFPQECSSNKLPEQCPSNEILSESFSSEFSEGDQLQLFFGDNLVHECNSIKDFDNFKNIIDEKYLFQFEQVNDTKTLKLTVSSNEALEKKIRCDNDYLAWVLSFITENECYSSK